PGAHRHRQEPSRLSPRPVSVGSSAPETFLENPAYYLGIVQTRTVLSAAPAARTSPAAARESISPVCWKRAICWPAAGSCTRTTPPRSQSPSELTSCQGNANATANRSPSPGNSSSCFHVAVSHVLRAPYCNPAASRALSGLMAIERTSASVAGAVFKV